MPYDWSQLQAAHAAVIDEYRSGYLVTIGAYQAPCVESALRASWAAELWGRDNTYRLTVTVMLDAIGGTAPAVRSTVTYRSTTYRILEISQAQLIGSVQLHLGDA